MSLMGMANPIPAAPRSFRLTTPTTKPASSTSGPPLLPGFRLLVTWR